MMNFYLMIPSAYRKFSSRFIYYGSNNVASNRGISHESFGEVADRWDADQGIFKPLKQIKVENEQTMPFM